MLGDSTRLPERDDTRPEAPLTAPLRDQLDYWLDLYRETTLLKVAGLTAEQLCARSAPPSTMSLVGMVRHLTEVEAYWIREVLAGEPDVPDIYSTLASRDGDFDDASPQTAIEDVAAYEEQVERTRAVLAGWRDLDALAVGTRKGKPVNLGWILTHLVEEYARHLGHMDLLRERIDGRVGY